MAKKSQELMIKNYAALRAVLDLHSTQKITLPNGEWGVNCIECDGYSYPCKTVQIIIKEIA